MLRHQGTNVLKAGGHSSQGKVQIGGGNFFKTLFFETNLIRSTIDASRGIVVGFFRPFTRRTRICKGALEQT